MVKSAAGYGMFCVKNKRKTDPRATVLDLGTGYGILTALHSFLKHFKGTMLKDSHTERIYCISDFQTHGSTILITAFAGRYGEESMLMNMQNGRTRYIPDDETPVRELRMLVACPNITEVEYAMYAIEYVEGMNGSYVLAEFLKQMRAIFNINMPYSHIMEKAAWLDQAVVEKMSVPLKSISAPLTLTDAESAQPVSQAAGRLKIVITPETGQNMLNSGFFAKLRGKNPADTPGLLTIAGVEGDRIDTDGISIQVQGPDQRRKTFLLGDEKGPRLLEQLTFSGQPRLDNNVFRMRASGEIRSKYAEYQIKLTSEWDKGDKIKKLTHDEEIEWRQPNGGDSHDEQGTAA